MSKRLENFIKLNKEEFDDLEPSANLWYRIETHLPAQDSQFNKRNKKTFTLGFVLSMAAAVILVMGIGFAVYLRTEKKEGIDLRAINPVYAQQQIKYTSLIETKRTELKTLAKSDPQLYQEFSAQIAKMEFTYKQLKSDLPNSPNQERVLQAMIGNLQIQTEVLNQQLNVIEQFNKEKKEQSNEIKNI